MYKLELFKSGVKIKELTFNDNEVGLLDMYRLKNRWNGGTSRVWELIIDNDVRVWKLIIDNDIRVEKGGPINE